jgi:ribosomal protein L29
MATKKQSVKGGNVDELTNAVEKKREELRGLRFAGAGSKNRNVKLVRELRKQVARALTEVRAQELAKNQ